MVTPSLQPDVDVRSNVEKRGVFAYRTLLVFSVLYFARPEDVIPGLGIIPVAKIAGGLALLALIVGFGSHFSLKKFPIELRLVTALFIWECLTIPFAWYKGGAFGYVTGKCSKTLIVAILVALVVTSMQRLRRLMYVQAAAVAGMTFVSVLIYRGGRMGGVLGGVFDNPNDLAINIAMNWPLCLMFLLRTRSPFKKLIWGVGMLFLIRGMMLTFSRSGFLALGVATIFCVYEFGVREKRRYLIAIAVAGVLLAAMFAPSGYGERMGSIFGKPLEVGDSQEARRELLTDSLQITATHPIFGLGPGNFASYTQTWRVTHNTYTELTSECGIPALIIFLFILRAAFRNLKRVRESRIFAEDPEVRLLTGGLWASLAGYLVGAFFASTAYQLFPYFLVAYTTALMNIASASGRKLPPVKSPLQTWKPNSQLVKVTNPW
jgi:O-antigen ligase